MIISPAHDGDELAPIRSPAKLGVVSEQADECVYWLTRFKNARISSTEPLEPLLAEAVEL
ncbi:MAG: hypothetical protein DMF87_24255 [Acidobacteria bacterium]|nr:MAG: hypothetical protein DMF87_24255 [Acidobacteriota bacterium]